MAEINFKAKLARYIDEHIADLISMQNADGSLGSYTYSNAQYPFHVMAYALKKIPDSSWHESEKLKSAAVRALDYYNGLVDEEGYVDFYGQAGFQWGRDLAGAWPLFFWQEALVLLEKELDSELFISQRAKIFKILKAHFDSINKLVESDPGFFKQDIHNLFIWKVLLIFRAGGLWKNDDWTSFGTRVMNQVVQAQNPDGWWSEGGPTVGYNLVTATAVSLYAEYSGDEKALSAMKKSAVFHSAFSYPDGSKIEAIDGRMRYSPGVMMFIPPSFARFPEGKRYLDAVARSFEKDKPLEFSSVQGFSFLGSIHENLPEISVPGSYEIDALKIFPGLKSALVKERGWAMALCGYENAKNISCFRLERQNLLSVWHKKTGLIVGGGHSKYQPEFSCFNVFERTGNLHYLHANSCAAAERGEMGLSMEYGGVPVFISVRIIDGKRIAVRYGVKGYTEDVFADFLIRANLILSACPGAVIECKKHSMVLDEKSFFWSEEDFGGGVKHNGWFLSIPKRTESVSVKWPFRAYNSYRPDRKSELCSAAMIASADLSPMEPEIEYEIRILDK